jgi:hypothetical protein
MTVGQKTLTLTQGSTSVNLYITDFNWEWQKTVKLIDRPKIKQKQSEGSYTQVFDTLVIRKQITLKGVIVPDGTISAADQKAMLQLMQENYYSTSQPLLKVEYDQDIYDPDGTTTRYGPGATFNKKIGGIITNLKVREMSQDLKATSGGISVDPTGIAADPNIHPGTKWLQDHGVYEVNLTIVLANRK